MTMTHKWRKSSSESHCAYDAAHASSSTVRITEVEHKRAAEATVMRAESRWYDKKNTEVMREAWRGNYD